MPDNRRFLLTRRPNGEPVADDFSLVTEPTPELADGQFLIRNHYASLGPSVTNYPSILGAVGMTAYFGYIDVCEPKPGDVVLVTGAAGAVGSLVGQIAKILGRTAIGIAGGAEK